MINLSTATAMAETDYDELLWQYISKYEPGDILFFKSQNEIKLNMLVNSIKSDTEDENRSIEFKRISPVKHRVIVHRVSSNFVLVFAENFHPAWEIFPKTPLRPDPTELTRMSEQYKILKGNAFRQASLEELKLYIENDELSFLGDGTLRTRETSLPLQDNKMTESYSIDYISKKKNGSIQNNNLKSGWFWETWGLLPLPEVPYHLKANGYANSWLIDLCHIQDNYPNAVIRNPDGTFNIEFVIEYKNQRYLYIGRIITALITIACIFLIFRRNLTKRNSD